MRALFQESFDDRAEYIISGDPLHHLVNVVRIGKNEELLLLNGAGLAVRTRVEEITKKALRLTRLESSVSVRDLVYDLAIGIPKKDALELSLKEAVELGFRKIFLVRSSYSQTRVPEPERIKALLVSALEQSNAPFLPEISEVHWDGVPWNDYGTVLVLDSQTGKRGSSGRATSPGLLVVGPEGGFTVEESAYFRSSSQGESLLLPTPILRTPTAVAAGAGVLLQRLMT